MELTTLRSLFIHELKDLYSAEKQLIKALPKVAKAANNSELKAGIEEHLKETIEHANRLENLLSDLGETTRGPKCKAMEGLIAEASGLIKEEADPEVLDAGIIAGSQKIEHYEIASYGCVRAYAELLGEEDAAGILQTTPEHGHGLSTEAQCRVLSREISPVKHPLFFRHGSSAENTHPHRTRCGNGFRC